MSLKSNLDQTCYREIKTYIGIWFKSSGWIVVSKNIKINIIIKLLATSLDSDYNSKVHCDQPWNS